MHIASRDFQFKFDKREKLGMITPIWCTDYPITKGQTTFRLELSPGESGAALAEHASKLEPSLLLFLRQLNTSKSRRLCPAKTRRSYTSSTGPQTTRT